MVSIPQEDVELQHIPAHCCLLLRAGVVRVMIESDRENSS